MIIDLCQTDLLKLVNGEEVTFDGHVVRTNDAANSVSSRPEGTHESRMVEEPYATTRKRSDAKRKLTGEPIYWRPAIFNGRCNFGVGCGGDIRKGQPILRDANNGVTLCETCGDKLYPNVKKAVTA